MEGICLKACGNGIFKRDLFRLEFPVTEVIQAEFSDSKVTSHYNVTCPVTDVADGGTLV
jgi:hypothetical protein